MSALKIIITLTDKPNGNVGLEMDFEPPMKTDHKTTPAMNLAMQMVDYVARQTITRDIEVNS